MNAVLKQGPDALAALLAYVAQVRDRKLAEIRAAADAERKALLDTARAKAREQARQALRLARRDADAQVAAARAAAHSRLRRASQALTLAALAGVHQRVAAAVRRRWADPALRSAWIALAFGEAARHLPPGAWSVAHAPGAAPRAPALPDGVRLEAKADAAIDAGLRIRCGAAEIDATAAGLLRAPERIAALWLGELERRRSAP